MSQIRLKQINNAELYTYINQIIVDTQAGNFDPSVYLPYVSSILSGVQSGTINPAVQQLLTYVSGVLASGNITYPQEYTKSLGYFTISISGDCWNRFVFDFNSGYSSSFTDAFSYRLLTVTNPPHIKDLMVVEDLSYREGGKFGLNLYYNTNGSGIPKTFDLMVKMRGTGWAGSTNDILSGVGPY